MGAIQVSNERVGKNIEKEKGKLSLFACGKSKILIWNTIRNKQGFLKKENIGLAKKKNQTNFLANPIKEKKKEFTLNWTIIQYMDPKLILLP